MEPPLFFKYILNHLPFSFVCISEKIITKKRKMKSINHLNIHDSENEECMFLITVIYIKVGQPNL